VSEVLWRRATGVAEALITTPVEMRATPAFDDGTTRIIIRGSGSSYVVSDMATIGFHSNCLRIAGTASLTGNQAYVCTMDDTGYLTFNSEL